MTEHQDDCGHNHGPNPYAIGDIDQTYQGFLDHLYRLMILSVLPQPMITGNFCAVQVTLMTHRPDSSEAERIHLCKAMAWEIGRLINFQSGPRPPQFEIVDKDDTSTDSEKAFATAAITAFMSAAAPGDLDTAVRVLDGVVAEARAHQENPLEYVVAFLTNIMISASYTTSRMIVDNDTDPRGMFNDD